MPQFFIGRQPVLNSEGDTIAYELLFRSSNINAFDTGVDGDSATSQVMLNSVVEFGLGKVVGNKLAFINLTTRFLEHPELVMFLPSDRVVLEVLETIELSEAVLKGIETLKAAQYTIALDDYSACDRLAELVPAADIIKYDISEYTIDQLRKIAESRVGSHPKLLAECVETNEQFTMLRDAGFDYFQGYFFARPEVLSGKKIPTNKGILLHLLAQINNESVTIDEIANLISREVSLGVRALRYVNSPLSGLHHKVSSIKQATVLLGRETIRHWVTLLLIADLNDKPMELVNMALIRGRFCQLIAQNEGLDDSAYFTAGLLSLVDVMIDIDMETVLDSISATNELRDVLQNRKGRASDILNVVEFFENNCAADAVPPVTESMNDAYMESIYWAGQTTLLMKA